MVILVNFGERIKELRMSKGLSLRELGSKLNIDYSTLGHYESGRRRPDFDTLVKLADYFRELLGGDHHAQRRLVEEVVGKVIVSEGGLIEVFLRGEEESSRTPEIYLR